MGEADGWVALTAAIEEAKRSTERASKRIRIILRQGMNLILNRAIPDELSWGTKFYSEYVGLNEIQGAN
jgi:hypothetical protein